MIKWIVKKANNGEYMVCYQECLSTGFYCLCRTFDEAWSVARGMGFGADPICA